MPTKKTSRSRAGVPETVTGWPLQEAWATEENWNLKREAKRRRAKTEKPPPCEQKTARGSVSLGLGL